MKHETVSERFLRYVSVDTQSDENSNTFPSTEKQKNLGRMLYEELKAMGASDAMFERTMTMSMRRFREEQERRHWALLHIWILRRTLPERISRRA